MYHPHPHFSSWPILWMHWRPGKGLGSTKNDPWSLCPTRSHCLLCPPWRKGWSEKPGGPRGSWSGRCPGNLRRKKGNGCLGLQKDRKQHMQGRETREVLREELELEIQRTWRAPQVSRLQPGSHAALSLVTGTLRMQRRKQIPSANTSFYTCYVGYWLRKGTIAAAYGCSSWGSSSAWGCSSWGCSITWGCSIAWGCSSACGGCFA